MSKHGLVRALTLKDAVGVGLGAIIGAGIFVVTGVAAGVSGPAFLVGLLIAGLIATFNGLSSAQLAAVYPQSGGTYEYGYQLLTPGFGFAAGWMFLLSKLSAAGVVAIGFGSYFSQLLPIASPLAFSVVAVVLLTIANLFGIQKVGRINLAIVAVNLLSLLYFVFSGLPAMDAGNFEPFAPFGLAGVAESAALLFFAFTGYARIATLAEEVRDPATTIPRAVIITIVTAILLYAAVSVVAIGVVGTEAMAAGTSPLQTVAASLKAPGVQLVVTIGASTAMLGVLLSQVIGISRMMLAIGRRKDLPAFLQTVHAKTRVPHVGIIITGILILLLTVFGSFEFIVRSATFTILLYYSIANLSALRQPAHQQMYGKAVPVLGLAGCLLMSAALPLNVILTGVVLLAVGFGVRVVVKKL
jgi:basic amino acid/polyamine antiporter, APA family